MSPLKATATATATTTRCVVFGTPYIRIHVYMHTYVRECDRITGHARISEYVMVACSFIRCALPDIRSRRISETVTPGQEKCSGKRPGSGNHFQTRVSRGKACRYPRDNPDMRDFVVGKGYYYDMYMYVLTPVWNWLGILYCIGNV